MFLVAALCPLALASQQEPVNTPSQRQKLWLQSVHKKVKKDSEQLVGLAGEMRAEATKHKGNPVSPALLARIESLETRAGELQKLVAAVDENILSVQVVTAAEGIKGEARALQGALAASPPGRPANKLRDLARQMEKRADAIADHMRLP